MLSVSEDADLMKASNWNKTNVLRYDSTFLNGKFGGWLEGNAVVDPHGNIVNMLRVDDKSTLDEKAAIVRINENGTEASFDVASGFVPFNGGSKKFMIQFDGSSELYWCFANIITDEGKATYYGKNPTTIRNTLALLSSPDLKNWTLRQIVLSHHDQSKHGFQYPDFTFEGNDIIFVSRTSYEDADGGAHNQHDANYLTFHRIKKFRKLPQLSEGF